MSRPFGSKNSKHIPTCKHGHDRKVVGVYTRGGCKECARIASRQPEVKERVRLYQRSANGRHHKFISDLKKYNLTLDQYNFLFQAQLGKCAICGIPQTEVSRRFDIDHDHNCCQQIGSCGKCIRGLLCADCNTSLGRLENLEFVSNATAYLAAHKRK